MDNRPERRLLRAARQLVGRSWCRGADARDGEGRAVNPWDEDAESWSLLGGIVAALEHEAARGKEMPLEDLAAALAALAELIHTDSLVAWNDDPARTQADVVAVLERAEAACESPAARFSISVN